MPPESRGEDEQRIAGGIDVRRRDAHDLVALMRVLHGMAQLSIDKRTVRPLMDFVYANLSGGADHIADFTYRLRARVRPLLHHLGRGERSRGFLRGCGNEPGAASGLHHSGRGRVRSDRWAQLRGAREVVDAPLPDPPRQRVQPLRRTAADLSYGRVDRRRSLPSSLPPVQRRGYSRSAVLAPASAGLQRRASRGAAARRPAPRLS